MIINWTKSAFPVFQLGYPLIEPPTSSSTPCCTAALFMPGNNGKQQAVAGAAAQQVVQGSTTHPGQPESCFAKSMDLCVGSTIFLLEFIFVVLFEFLHSYCGWSAWFCKVKIFSTLDCSIVSRPSLDHHR